MGRLASLALVPAPTPLLYTLQLAVEIGLDPFAHLETGPCLC
jgi:hypothetical protein